MKTVCHFLFSLFFVTYFLPCAAQYGVDSIHYKGITGSQAQYRMALLQVKALQGKDTVSFVACGFILKNSYVATCYHLLIMDSTLSLLDIKVLYNIREKPMVVIKVGTASIYRDPLEFFIYDSVYATLDYKPNKRQYNFKRHVYNESDPASDFIILKLHKKVKCMEPVFDTSKVLINDRLTATGYSRTKSFRTTFSSSIETVFYVDSSRSGYFMIITEGIARHGYSGSPLFNTKGYIVGMLLMGMKRDKLPENLKQMFDAGLINADKYKRMVKLMEDNPLYSIAQSINIGYLLKRYMKGYY